MIHNVIWSLNNNLIAMNELQLQLSTGKRIHKPSDDPVGTTKIIKLKSDIAENTQYKTNARDATSWLEMSENSLTDIKDIEQRLRELAVQAANGSNTPEDTAKIAAEVDQLTEEIIVVSNSSIAGRYLFSGFQTDTPLLNKDGTYNIDVTAEDIEDFQPFAYEVSIGEPMDVGSNYLDFLGYVPEDTVAVDTFVFGDPRYKDVEAEAATHTRVQGPIDLDTDLSGVAGDVTINVDGKVFRVDKSKLDGTLTQSEFVHVLNSAEQITPPPTSPVPTLGSEATIYFSPGDGSSARGELLIENKAFGGQPVTVDPNFASIYSSGPTTVLGADAPNAVLTGTKTINDMDMKIGTNSFVVTYNGKSERIDVEVEVGDTVADFETKVNDTLKDSFGTNGASPPVNNVSMSATSGGVVSFTGLSKNDGSRTDLKVDVIMTKKPQLIQDLEDFSKALNEKDDDGIQSFLGKIDDHLDNTLGELAEIGAKTNRLTFIENRIDDNDLTMTAQLSAVQDIDYAATTIAFKSMESIYRASLSVGAMVIQPTLVDFI